MGLLKGDLEKVPSHLTLRDLYERIYDWHRKNLQTVNEAVKDEQSNLAYLELVRHLPAPSKATEDDIALVCREVIVGLMEWAYHKKDKYDIKTAAYAHFALKRFFGDQLENLRERAKNSKLYPYSLEEFKKKQS